ncbi:hypothetical protein EDF60_1743 [Leucobacter luti]|uniref:Asp23/Gls24 family envelope stress response protein n=1 Tax=Leucobacter luti TaxID=340320 RepID=UPI0010528214|nr:Asp23/Gls24 family envelope stress response protein [Leucobacter luti]MCW2287093.1 putative alkaline shock family protein YloU [Leucobacter luti]TCK41317.1 hypothetical protein EDF60_1743 [Leucobacter luti]
MNEAHGFPELRGALFEPDSLDGFTLEQLSEYLDAGRTPADPAIETSPGCQLALDALANLREFRADLLARDTAAEAPADESWVQGVLAGIALDARAGRRVPVSASDAGVDLGITEGAVRGLIRAAEARVPGVLVGGCRLDGDVTAHGAPTRITVDASVRYGIPIPAVVAQLRSEIAGRLATHTELNISGIDITIRDIQWLPRALEEDQ